MPRDTFVSPSKTSYGTCTGTKTGDHRLGGATILTARHCVKATPSLVGGPISVTNLKDPDSVSNWQEIPANRSRIVRIYFPGVGSECDQPGNTPACASTHDVAVLEIADSMAWIPIAPVDLDPPVVGRQLTMVGYGKRVRKVDRATFIAARATLDPMIRVVSEDAQNFWVSTEPGTFADLAKPKQRSASWTLEALVSANQSFNGVTLPPISAIQEHLILLACDMRDLRRYPCSRSGDSGAPIYSVRL